MKLIDTQTFLKKIELQEFPQPDIIQLRYPVLLCHGYGALASVIKPSPMHEVCMLLRSHGVIAFAPNIVPYATIETRAKEWANKLEQLCDGYGFEQMNVIAHSMSGLDMRVALQKETLKSRVASLTTVATPHKGTSLADLVLKTPDQVRNILGEAFNWFGNNVYPKSKSDAVGAVRQLTRDYVTGQFNPSTPDVEDVTYFSYSAAVGKGTSEPLNPIYRYQNQYIHDEEGVNDAFVSDESARYGIHIECAPISHLEQIRVGVSRDRLHMYESFWSNMVKTLSDKGF